MVQKTGYSTVGARWTHEPPIPLESFDGSQPSNTNRRIHWRKHSSPNGDLQPSNTNRQIPSFMEKSREENAFSSGWSSRKRSTQSYTRRRFRSHKQKRITPHLELEMKCKCVCEMNAQHKEEWAQCMSKFNMQESVCVCVHN